MVLVDLLSLVQVVPVGLSVELIHDSAFLNHISSDIEGVISLTLTTGGGQSHGLVVEIQVASDSDSSVSVDNHHVLIGTEFETHDEGVDVHGVVVGATAFLITISESDEGVDLSDLGFLGPCSDDQEGAHNVPVDGEVEVGELGIHAGFVDSVGVPEVVPVFGLEKLVNFWPDIEESDGGLSLGDRHGGVVEVVTLGLADSDGEAHGEQQSDVELVHIQYNMRHDR